MQRDHAVSCDEGFFGDRGRTVNAELFRHRAVVDAVVFNK